MFNNIKTLKICRTLIVVTWSVAAVALLLFIGSASGDPIMEPIAKIVALLYFLSCLPALSVDSYINKKILRLKKEQIHKS